MLYVTATTVSIWLLGWIEIQCCANDSKRLIKYVRNHATSSLSRDHSFTSELRRLRSREAVTCCCSEPGPSESVHSWVVLCTAPSGMWGWLLQFSSVAQSCLTLRPHEPQHGRPPWPSPTPGVYPNPCPLSPWCHPAISSSIIPFSSAFNLSQHQGLFQRVSTSHQVVKVLELQLQHQSFQWVFRVDFL